MTDRFVSVGDDFNLPAVVNVLDENLPANLQPAALTTTILSEVTAPIAAAVAPKLDVSTAADSYVPIDGTKGVTWPSGLIAFWDFAEAAPPFYSKAGAGRFPLSNGTGATVTKHATEVGPFGSAADFDGSTDYLKLDAAQVGALNVARTGDEVTVLAWVRRDANENDFIAGMWQEDNANPKRQYGLFIDLPLYGGNDRVCGHVSRTGGASPGSPYSRDYAASCRVVGKSIWRLVGFTYDGSQVISYIDGQPDQKTNYTEPAAPDGAGLTYDKNPYLFDLGLNRTSVSDFTVGAVKLTAGMGNWFDGQIGGLAVFNRALTHPEIVKIHLAAKKSGEPIHHETFEQNDGQAVTNIASKLLGWKSLRGSTATDTGADGGLNNFAITGVAAAGGGVNSYIFRGGTGGGTDNLTMAGLGYFDMLKGFRFSQVKEATFRLHNSHAVDKIRLAVRIGTSWYATAAEYSVTGDGRVGSDMTTAETKTVAFERTAALWRDLTVTPGTALTLAGAARTVDLPNGEMTGIGFYSPVVNASGNTVRIDDLKLFSF